MASSQLYGMTETTEVNEEALLERALKNDSAALGSIYDLYSDRIYRYVYHRIGNAEVAEDITAQTFLKMLEAIQTGRGWHTSFRSWLYRIAHNLVVDHYRRASKVMQVSLDKAPNLPQRGDSLMDTVERKLDMEAVEIALHSLTEEQAQVIVLRFLEGYNIAEVSKIMEKTEGAVKALQYRAVRALQQLMKK